MFQNGIIGTSSSIRTHLPLINVRRSIYYYTVRQSQFSQHTTRETHLSSFLLNYTVNITISNKVLEHPSMKALSGEQDTIIPGTQFFFEIAPNSTSCNIDIGAVTPPIPPLNSGLNNEVCKTKSRESILNSITECLPMIGSVETRWLAVLAAATHPYEPLHVFTQH